MLPGGPPSEGGPADSQVIEGPDCGNVKQIVGKWQKAGATGALAGAAQAAILNAERAAQACTDAVQHAQAEGAKLDQGGAVPEMVQNAVNDATSAGAAATSAAGSLQSELDGFRTKITSGDIAGSDVMDADIVSLKRLTEDAEMQAANATEAAARVMAQLDEAQANALEKTSGSLEAMASVLEAAEPLHKQASELGQQAGFAVQTADSDIAAADKVSPLIDAKVSEATTQKPVWEAFKADFDARKQAVETAKADLQVNITALGTEETDIKTLIDELEKISYDAQKDPTLAHDQEVTIDELKEAIRLTEHAIVTVQGQMTTLDAARERLNAKVKEAEEKLA